MRSSCGGAEPTTPWRRLWANGSDGSSRWIISLPQGVELYALRLHETATSYAEWFASDNL